MSLEARTPLNNAIDDAPDGSRKGMSRGCKCCIGCSVIAVIALGVGIPIGIFVVGPAVAQSVLDRTIISLPNLTQAACPANYTWLFNSAKIQVPGIGPIGISSHLESYTQEVWTTACDNGETVLPGALCDNNATERRMGYYTSPAMTVSKGDNFQNFTVVMTSNSSLILFAWVQPLWLSQQKTRLILTAKDVTVNVMGIKFKGLSMRNDMTCTGVPELGTISIPASVCYPGDPKAAPYPTSKFRAICESGVHSIKPTTTTSTPTTTTTSKAAEMASKAAAIFT
jgi:hypothetical protein